MIKRIAIFTELIRGDADGARLAERVEECASDHYGSIVQWLQTWTWLGSARLTAVVTWQAEEDD